jgi:hypothetical protein
VHRPPAFDRSFPVEDMPIFLYCTLIRSCRCVALDDAATKIFEKGKAWELKTSITADAHDTDAMAQSDVFVVSDSTFSQVAMAVAKSTQVWIVRTPHSPGDRTTQFAKQRTVLAHPSSGDFSGEQFIFISSNQVGNNFETC